MGELRKERVNKRNFKLMIFMYKIKVYNICASDSNGVTRPSVEQIDTFSFKSHTHAYIHTRIILAL